jgi:hypothetical protein
MKRDQLEDLSLDGKIISKLIFKKCYGGHDWIKVAQDRSKW